MKILVAGDWSFEHLEESIYKALSVLGHEVVRFPWGKYFVSSGDGLFYFLNNINCRFQNKYLVGPIISRLNHDLVAFCRKIRPDIVFVHRGTHIKIGSLHAIRQYLPSVRIIGYNNDDPFSDRHHFRLWSLFLRAVPEYDLILAYRHHNLSEFLDIGAKRVELLRSWYVPELNHPVELSQEDKEKFRCDVVFVGHYEPDGRLELLEKVVKMGYKLKLFGPEAWNKVLAGSSALRHLIPIKGVYGEEYAKALAGAKVALCFLSKLNRDTYTRRCFEIPATKTFMLSEYTQDLASLLGEDTEAVYFRTRGEFVSKLCHFLANDTARSVIAHNGYNRVVNDGHDIYSRLSKILDVIDAGTAKLS